MSRFITTTSKVAVRDHTKSERELLQKWCDEAARVGGTFAIAAGYDPEQGHCITYEINWPCATEEVRAAAAIDAQRRESNG